MPWGVSCGGRRRARGAWKLRTRFGARRGFGGRARGL